MTEDQARQTQCCGGEGCGYVNPTDSVRYCVAHSCMAWRWNYPHTPKEVTTTQNTKWFEEGGYVYEGEPPSPGPGWEPDDAAKEFIPYKIPVKSGIPMQRHWIRDRPRPARGHCGLAGNP